MSTEFVMFNGEDLINKKAIIRFSLEESFTQETIDHIKTLNGCERSQYSKDHYGEAWAVMVHVRDKISKPKKPGKLGEPWEQQLVPLKVVAYRASNKEEAKEFLNEMYSRL